MARTPFIVASAVAALLSLGACAGGGDDAKSEDELRDALSSRFEADGLDAEQAECYADLVIEEVGVDELNDTEVGDEEPTEAQQEAYATAARRATEECDIDESSLDG